jgi:hypothetical protein
MPLNGSTVLSSTLLSPGTQSFVAPAPNGAAWVTGTLSTPLLPLQTLSEMGNAFALRVTSQNAIDQTVRFGGLPSTNAAFSSAPVNPTSITTDPTGQPIFSGSVAPTTSSSLLATQTYDLSLYNTPTAALPSTLRDAVLPPGSCGGSLCAGSAAFLSKLSPTTAPSLALSTDDTPNLTLRNLGSSPADNLQITATGFIPTHNCPATLQPGGECSILLTGTGPGTITVQAANATTQTATLPATTALPNPIVFSPKELDFGVQTTTSPATTRTITITNLSQQSQTFTSSLDGNTSTPYTLAETFSDCALASPTTKLLAAGATCHITLGLTTSPGNDGPIATNWSIGTGDVLLTGYAQTAPLNVSAPQIDFGTQFSGATALRLPRFLHLSNNSAASIPHAPITLPVSSPFTIADHCPTQLDPHTVCQLQLNYQSTASPSSDSTTLTLDQGLTVLVTGKTIPQPGANGSATNPNLSVTPATLNFPNAVVVTGTSSATQNVTVANTGTQPFVLSFALSGDFTDTTNCPTTLPGGVICTVIVSFAPAQPGTRQGLLSVTAGAGTTPAYVDLSGTATPILASNNGTIPFGSVIIGEPSVQWFKIAQPLGTLTAASFNPAFTAILVEDLGYGHGQHPSSAFVPTTTGPCTNCWLGLQFKPSTAGQQSASLSLNSSTTGNPYHLSLTGNGLALTGLLLSPSTQDFGPTPINSTTAPTLFTLTDLSPSPIALTSAATTGDFAISNTATGGQACTGSLAPTASCFLQITFTPTSSGQRTGTLNLQTSYGTVTSTLTGFGSPDPGLSLNPTSLIFKNIPGPTATQQTITLTNTSLNTLQIATPTNAATNFHSTTTCGTLVPSSTCTITVTFTPSNAYASDVLQIPATSSASGNPITTYTIPLSGLYTTEDTALQIIPNRASYGPTATGDIGLTRQFTINNLTAQSLNLNLALPRQFVLTGSPCTSLAPNAACDFTVAFLPLTNGDITGTLFAQATPTSGGSTLNSIGYVEGYGTGTGSLNITGNLFPPGILNFNQVTSGQTASQTLTLSNTSTSPITVRRITSGWPFLSTTTCGTTLASNQSCTVTIAYTPLNQLAAGTTSPLPSTDAGSLVIESDAASSPDIIDLTGTAAPILVASPSNTAPLVSFTASQGSFTFAPTKVGNASAPQTVTLTNTGTAAIHITGVQTTSDFTVVNACSTIVPGANCTLTASFTPQAAGTRIGAVEIASDSSTSLDFISLLGTASPSVLIFSPTSLDFGTLLVGTTGRLPIQITNSSPIPATFNGISTTGDYAVAGTCPSPGGTLAPSTSCTLQLSFTPTQPGTRPGTVSLSTSISTLPLTAQLTGIGAQSHLQISPASLSFGSIAIAASANRTLTLANTGTAPINTVALSITGDYAITIPCALTSLAPGASCSVTITFTPRAVGPRAGALTVASTDQSSPTTVPLTGSGIADGSFALTVDGSTTSTITVKSGKPAAYSLSLIPGDNFSGAVVLNCTPINPGQYATCSLLPSSITLNGAAQSAIATINTITSVSTAANKPRVDATLLCMLPTALLFFWKIRRTRRSNTLWLVLLTAAALSASGCGSGIAPIINTKDPNLRYTPPGTYRYQVTASSISGVQITQTVTLNLIVTAQ